MKLHLVDGTYELFRAYYGAPSAHAPDGTEVGATRAFARSMLALLARPEVTHVAVAFDRVIESFRNDLFPGYKTGEGIDPALWAQFPLAEQAASALGIVVWGMVEFEADDALASAAARWREHPEVECILVCTPDKDLAQCVVGERVVLADRMRDRIIDEAGVLEKWGIAPASMPDYLALVGDSADGIPGIPRWGAKSASAVLAHYRSLESIPDDARAWAVSVRGAAALAQSLREHRAQAALYKILATLRTDVPLRETLEDLRWRGAEREQLERLSRALEDQRLVARVTRWR